MNLKKANQYSVANATVKQRKAKLTALQKALLGSYKQKFRDALYADFKRHATENDLMEIFPVINEIKFAKKHLREWMGKNRVPTPMALLGTSSWIHYEPKGVSLILSPWNFPIHLTLCPLVSAIAAGCTAIIKPSEMTPNCSAVLGELVAELFDENEVALVEGGVEESTELLQLPFNHIYFTGSPQIGKIVMAAAAKNLTSVTLELGGKSPTIIHKSANIKVAAEKIAWGRFINNGQTCLAPDYIMVDESIKEKFVTALKMAIEKLFGDNPKDSDSYCRIVNNRHFGRLKSHIDDAISKGGKIEIGGEIDEKENYISPTVISNITDDSLVLTEEIFGPILPIKTFKDNEELLNYINSKEKALALYVYAKNRRFENFIIKNTRSGSTCINNNILQYTNHYLPFGGSNNSGIGKVHGVYGFQEFSNMRSVMKQHTFGALQLLFPPYNNFKQKLTDSTIKWF